MARDYEDWAEASPSSSEEAYRVFLVGNTGGSEREVLQALTARLAAADGERSAVVFLGDNVSCCGLADSAEAGRARGEDELNLLISAVEDFEGRVIILPGDREWSGGQWDGLAALARQEAYLESRFDHGNVFLPDEGFPGPVEIDLTPRVTLVALDTQWWLHPHEKSLGDAGPYDVAEKGDFVVQLEDVLARNRRKDVLVVGHHPIRSVGEHAGRFPLRNHLFPLARVVPGAYVPLPIIGSAFPLYTRYVGGPQDLHHREYAALREALASTFAKHEKLI